MLYSNFVVIQGDQPRKIEKDGETITKFEKEFKIDGVDAGGSGVVLLSCKGLVGDAEAVTVDINGEAVGKLYPNKNADAESWFTHILHFSASEGSLNPNPKNAATGNTISIPGKESATSFSKFYVQNVICFYKVDVPKA